jgi:hypothetical protein
MVGDSMLLLSSVRHFIRAARVPAVAGEFEFAPGVVTVLAAILLAGWGHAVARRVRAFVVVGHTPSLISS